MSTLVEIEDAAAKLSPSDKEQLLLFLAATLRAGTGGLPPPREFSREEMATWIAADEAEMQRFRDGT